jgi:endonuclease-3
MTKQQKVGAIIERLSKIWPNPQSELNYSTPLELLVATMLSAQTTDKTVNTVTPALFAAYHTAQDYASADIQELDALISKINFHRIKAKNIIAAAQLIVNKHHGQVPQTLEELDELPGVARKTANVVLGNAFHKNQGIAVDTHVIRLTNALGLTTTKDPVKIEQDLMAIVPQEWWTNFSHLLILYGRYYAPARQKLSSDDLLADLYI